MDMLQAALAAETAFRQIVNRRSRVGCQQEQDFYSELDRSSRGARRALLACAIGVASIGVVLSVIAVSAAPQGVLIAGIGQ